MSPRLVTAVTFLAAVVVIGLYLMSVVRRYRAESSLLAGIRLPVDLVPLVSIAPRPDVDDQVAFWTKDVPAEAVGQAFAGELVRLGFTVAPLKEGAVRAERDGAALLCQVHATPSIVTVDGRQAFPSMPEGAVVVEVRVPA